MKEEGDPVFSRQHQPHYSEISAIIQAAIHPLVNNLQDLENKVDRLNEDRVTRTDIEKLRTELVGAMVPRDSYEPRHAALVDRDTQLEGMIREGRRELDERVRTFEERFTHGSEQFQQYLKAIDQRIEESRRYFEERVKQQTEAQLSVKDRAWLRWSQVIGFISVVISLLAIALQHVHLQ